MPFTVHKGIMGTVDIYKCMHDVNVNLASNEAIIVRRIKKTSIIINPNHQQPAKWNNNDHAKLLIIMDLKEKT